MDVYGNKKALDELSKIYLNLDEISADTALAASKEADKKRGQLAAAGDKEGAAKKAKQASDLYKAAAEKRKTETSSSSGGNYPKGKGADYKEGFSYWRDELREISVEPVPKDPETVVKEKNVKNKVVIDPEVKLEQVLGAEKVEVVVEEECPKCHKEDCKCAEIEEEILWDRVARDLTRLGEMGGTKFKVTPFDEAKVDTGSAAEKATARNKRNTPAGKDYDFDNKVFITRKPGESLDSARTRKRRDAHAAKRGVKQEGYQRNPEAGEKKERESAKKREAIPGQASRGMPPRGNKKREEFEKWYREYGPG